MTRSAVERTSPRAIPRESPVNPPPGQQLVLIDVGGGGRGTGQDRLDLHEQIAALERELRYYRRVMPALARAAATPRRPSREPAGELTHLARWLTDGPRVIESISRILAEQPQLEMRLEAVERAHRQIRDEVAHLLDDEPDEGAAGLGLNSRSWFRAGLWIRAGFVALILAIVAIVSVPYFIDWWQAVIQPRHG